MADTILRIRIQKVPGQVQVKVFPPGTNTPADYDVPDSGVAALLQRCLHIQDHRCDEDWYELFGRELGQLLARDYLAHACSRYTSEGRARIIVETNDSPGDAASAVPWELCQALNPDTARYFPVGEDERITITRVPITIRGEKRTPTDADERLRVLLVASNSDNMADLEREFELVSARIREPKRPNEKTKLTEDVFEIDVWRGARVLACLDALRRNEYVAGTKEDLARQFEIIHIFAHGARQHESSILSLSRANGDRADVNANQLLEWIAGKCHVLILQCCSSASIAPLALNAGVPAVVSMLHDITSSASTRFVGHLYQHLANGEPLDVAVQMARKQVKGTAHLGAPVLYARDREPVILRVGPKSFIPAAGKQSDAQIATSPAPHPTVAERTDPMIVLEPPRVAASAGKGTVTNMIGVRTAHRRGGP